MTTTQWQTTVPATEARPRNGAATAGFALSILALLVGWVPILGFLVVGPALGLSISGLRRSRDGRAATPGRSVAGIVMSAIGAVLCVAHDDHRRRQRDPGRARTGRRARSGRRAGAGPARPAERRRFG